MMERSESLTTMAGLKLYGMKAAFDEIITTAVKRQHEPQQIVGDLLTAEITEKQVRSIKYQITLARLPLAKDIGDFAFDGTPVNETLVRDCQRQLPGSPTQRRAGRRNRDWQDASRHRDCPRLHPRRCQGDGARGTMPGGRCQGTVLQRR
jgi:hypothetical protein